MENKNGSGIFLGVVGVATLVVAIIGATFAYFTAQIEGNNDIEATAYVFASSLSVTEISGKATTAQGLIPMANTLVETAVNTGSNNLKCVDKNGYDACEIYELKFGNEGSAAVTFDGTLTIDTNKFEANHLQLVEFGANVDGGQTLGSLKKTETHALATTGTVELEEVTVPVGGKTIYLVVYLEELEDANDADMGDTFKGSLTYKATTGEELTASFSA